MKHSFSIILSMCVFMVIGLALIPMLDISNKPRPRQGKTLTIQFSWPNASAKVVEQNATSVIEGLATSVKGVENVSSDSYYGSGRVVVNLKKGVDVSGVKFEIASLLRQIKDKLPEGVSYPSLSGGEIQTGQKKGEGTKHILTYQVNAQMEDLQIKEVVENVVKPQLEQIDGVHHIEVTGGKGRYIEISYNAQTLANYGLNASDIGEGVRNFMGQEDVVGDVIEYDGNSMEYTRIPLFLTTGKFSRELESMPLRRMGDKIVYLNNLASYDYKDYEPNSYYRVNGMNTIYINVVAESDRNIQTVSDAVKNSPVFSGHLTDSDIHFTKTYDRAEEELSEFNTLVKRSGISLLLLLLFVWLCRREWKYLIIITVTLLANILLAVIAFWGFDIRLHPFSLAGITVSLGMIIDASIVMVDHYSYYRNCKAFMAILAALLTTIASLVVVFWLPENLKNELFDFSWTVIITLTIALLVAVLFVPALVERIQYNSKQKGRPRHLSLIRRWNRLYEKYIIFVQKRTWIYYILLILAFGIPVHLLPEKIGKNHNESDNLWYETLYNKTFGSDFFRNDCKQTLSYILGGTMRLFSESLDRRPPMKEEEKKLHIRAQMPLGGSATELNQKVEILESFLSGFDGVKLYETRINGGGANITVEFTKEALETTFPYELENKVIGKVIMIGGTDWSTHGVRERGFSNSLNLQYRSNSIEITGYDYTRLYRYAEEICKMLGRNSRVTDISIETPGHENQEDELYLIYDHEALARSGLNVSDIHRSLGSLLTETNIGRYEDEHLNTQMVLRSTERGTFDLWQLDNTYLKIQGQDIRLSDCVNIERREAKNCISKRNQEYVLRVAFNVLGSYTYTSKYIKTVVEEIDAILPVGFRCQNRIYGWGGNEATKYWLIGLIVIIIFFICATLFESLRQAFVIIMLIPTSLIGVFLTYYFSDVFFGLGGLAAMVLLCGLSVNAGIYLINEYNHLKSACPVAILQGHIKQRLFLKAYNHKIVPILLTVLSTVVGLIPFLFDTGENSFWYSFAVGSLGGLFFSIIALVFVLPLLLSLKNQHYVNQSNVLNM